jgi:SAM-dependent methyltransferase
VTQASRYSDGTYRFVTDTWHDEDSALKARWISEFLLEQRVYPDSICDVGCGTGGVLAELLARRPGVRAVGYEVSSEAARIAADVHPNVEVRVGDATAVGDRFDLALLIDVFEHVEDYLGFLRRVSVLADLVLFHIPLDMTALTVARERPLLAARERVGHLHYFSKATALATLADAGYTVIATKFTPGGLLAPNRTLKTRVAALPRRLAFRFAPLVTARILGGFSLLVLARPNDETTGSLKPPSLFPSDST